jgi:hypothetical protein
MALKFLTFICDEGVKEACAKGISRDTKKKTDSWKAAEVFVNVPRGWNENYVMVGHPRPKPWDRNSFCVAFQAVAAVMPSPPIQMCHLRGVVEKFESIEELMDYVREIFTVWIDFAQSPVRWGVL